MSRHPSALRPDGRPPALPSAPAWAALSRPFAILAAVLAAAALTTASAQTYGLRQSSRTSADSSAWLSCATWDNAVPDAYTSGTISRGTASIDGPAKAARLTLENVGGADGTRLVIAPGGSLTITGETNTPANQRRYDERAWLTSHNAFSSYEYNVLWAQQDATITDQLDAGVRALMLDAYDWDGAVFTLPLSDIEFSIGDLDISVPASELGDELKIDVGTSEDVYLCHGDCRLPFLNPNTLDPAPGLAAGVATGAFTAFSGVFFPQIPLMLTGVGLITVPVSAALAGGAVVTAYGVKDLPARMTLEHSLVEVREFLDRRPDAIITLFIEDYAEVDNIYQQFIDAGLTGKMYDPVTDHPEGAAGCWPTVEWMQQNDKRLVVFLQKEDKTVQDEASGDARIPLLGQKTHTVENGYDIGPPDEPYDFSCSARGGGFSGLDDRSRKLFVMNQFSSIPVPTEYRIWEEFSGPFDVDLFTANGSPNQYQTLLNRIENQCWNDAKRYPNFVALDFVQYPSSGGGLAVTRELDGRWQPDLPYAFTPPSGHSIAASVAGDGEPLAGGALIQEAEELPFALEGNVPNPFQGRTTIVFTLPRQQHVALRVYDLIGREVALVADGAFGPGRHRVGFDSGSLPSGVYLYRLQSDTDAATRRMLVIR